MGYPARKVRISELFRVVEIEVYMSKTFERWKTLAVLASKERDPEKLKQLAHEMNLLLTEKTPYLNPTLRELVE